MHQGRLHPQRSPVEVNRHTPRAQVPLLSRCVQRLPEGGGLQVEVPAAFSLPSDLMHWAVSPEQASAAQGGGRGARVPP